MDIGTHAIVGAITGGAYGHPYQGALLAVLPDIALPWRRRKTPPETYDIFHSLLWITLVSIFTRQMWPFWCLSSHLCLDTFSHGPVWGTPLLWPWGHRFSFQEEWEFFNHSWWKGLFVACLWCLIIWFR